MHDDGQVTIVASGYLRSWKRCIYANVNLTAIETDYCWSANLTKDKGRRFFQWTNYGHMMVMGKCVTHNSTHVTLDYCSERNPYQVGLYE